MYNYLNKYIIDGDEKTLILSDGAGVVINGTTDGQSLSHNEELYKGVIITIRIFDKPYSMTDLFISEVKNGEVVITINENMKNRMKNISVASDHSSITLDINTKNTYRDVRAFLPYDIYKDHVVKQGYYPEISNILVHESKAFESFYCIEIHGVEKTDRDGRIIFVNNYSIVESSMLDVRKMSSDQLKVQSRK